jgi:hypothetical protein
VLDHASLPSAAPDQPLPGDLELCGRAVWWLFRDGVVTEFDAARDAAE